MKRRSSTVVSSLVALSVFAYAGQAHALRLATAPVWVNLNEVIMCAVTNEGPTQQAGPSISIYDVDGASQNSATSTSIDPSAKVSVQLTVDGVIPQPGLYSCAFGWVENVGKRSFRESAIVLTPAGAGKFVTRAVIQASQF